jgi:hypothetical protein
VAVSIVDDGCTSTAVVRNPAFPSKSFERSVPVQKKDENTNNGQTCLSGKAGGRRNSVWGGIALEQWAKVRRQGKARRGS